MWTFAAHWWATGLVLAEIAYCAAATWYLARSPRLQTVPVARCLRHLRMLQLIRTGRPPAQASFLIRRREALSAPARPRPHDASSFPASRHRIIMPGTIRTTTLEIHISSN
jgi:hypothetical protein